MLKSKTDIEKLTVKLGIVFSQFKLSPNKWTLLSLIFAFFGFLSLTVCHDIIKGLTFFAISGFLDMVDGAVARVTGRATNFGAFLDGIADRYVEFFLYIGLLIFGVNSLYIALLIFGALMPSFVTAYSSYRNVITEKEKHRKMAGLIERAERLILIYFSMLLGTFNLNFLEYGILITAILSNITAIQRILFVFRYR